jgi:diguanylate cyclase (GGDEF)-like protein
MWTKLRGDFTLALVVAFGAFTVLGVTPFAVYRFAQGQLLIGLLDLVLVATISIGAAYAWFSGRSKGTALLIAVICSAGCIVVAHLVGLSGLLWVYPVLLANFLLVGRRHAAILSAVVIAAVTFVDPILPAVMHKAIFVVTALEVSLFSYVFAWRAETQRTQLEAMAAHDPLTGAHNRRNMAAELKTAMAASIRDGTPLGLLIFDLDHFKSVNDTLGHEAGDGVLVQVSEVVRRATRKQDGFFRLGGEEFGLLLPGADSGSLHRIAEKLRTTVAAEVRCGNRGVTMSVGAASYCPGESAGSWQRRADLAMYRAKRDGRNRTVLDDNCEHVPVVAGEAPCMAAAED